MGLEVQVHAPFGSVSPGITMNLDGESEVLVDKSIDLHVAMSKRWARKIERLTGMRVGRKHNNHYKGSPFSKEELARRVTAGGNIGGRPGWQDDPSKIVTDPGTGARTNKAELEAGGEHWYNNREEMGKYAESIGIDLDQMEKVLEGRRTRLVYPLGIDPEIVEKEGVIVGRRTAMNNADYADALAIDYLHDFQFQISAAGQIEPLLGEQVDIPAGSATYQVPLMGPAQMYRQGPVTTESYTANPAVQPTVSKTVWTPFKLAMAMWATGEFDEDSVAPWIPAMEKAAKLGRGITLDHMFLRGHTTSTAALNINAFGGALALGANDPRLCMNGFFGANWDGTINGGSAGAFKGVPGGSQYANLNMIAALRAKLNKYGIDATPLRAFAPISARAQFITDAKARPDTYSLLLRVGGAKYYIDDVELVFLADSLITHGSSGGMPTYAGWISEGSPVNLQPDGTYTGSDGLHYAIALVNMINWLKANKRRYNWQVVRLPLSDQIAVVGTERFDVKPVHPNVSEVVLPGLLR